MDAAQRPRRQLQIHCGIGVDHEAPSFGARGLDLQ